MLNTYFPINGSPSQRLQATPCSKQSQHFGISIKRYERPDAIRATGWYQLAVDTCKEVRSKIRQTPNRPTMDIDVHGLKSRLKTLLNLTTNKLVFIAKEGGNTFSEKDLLSELNLSAHHQAAPLTEAEVEKLNQNSTESEKQATELFDQLFTEKIKARIEEKQQRGLQSASPPKKTTSSLKPKNNIIP